MKYSLLTLLVAISFVYSNDKADEIYKKFDNTSHGLTECSAYFAITSKAVGQDKKLKKRLLSYYELSNNLSLLYAEKANRDIKMASKVVLSRYEMTLDFMTKEINNDLSNISILTNKYQKNCVDLISKSSNSIQAKNIGFLQNQKYVCINQGMLINGKLETTMSEEEALQYPIRFLIDNNMLKTDAGLSLPLADKENQIYKDDDTVVTIAVNDNKRMMLFAEKLMNYVPTIYFCQETENWTLSKEPN